MDKNVAFLSVFSCLFLLPAADTAENTQKNVKFNEHFCQYARWNSTSNHDKHRQ